VTPPVTITIVTCATSRHCTNLSWYNVWRQFVDGVLSGTLNAYVGKKSALTLPNWLMSLPTVDLCNVLTLVNPGERTITI
jgi:hypothetical protein